MEPFDPSCKRYAKDMEGLDNFWAESKEDFDSTKIEDRPNKRVEFVMTQEGTYNSKNGHFLCDRCYIEIGMPSSPTGWICP